VTDGGPSTAATTTRSPARIVSLACWVVIVAVFGRIASGGGSLTGLGYVLVTEPAVVVVTGTLVLVCAAVAGYALVRDRPWAWPASRFGASVTLLGGLLLFLGGHDSAVVAGLAALVARVVAVRAIASGAGSVD
jgi:hypothetical protein